MNQKAYRLRTGCELTKPADYPAGSVFTISDLHLDHENIISYCNRPFHSTAEMNRVLIDNWNNVVKPTDTVFYVGDMSFGKTDKFIRKLHGNIIFISGNHDETDDIDRIQEYAYLSYKDITFLFVHDPWMKPAEFQGWTIHGHHHNNNPEKYPFFDPDKKKINVSVEMIRYHPYPMDCIVNMIKENHERIVTG
jgi:calcineurin-like phosphoesterase family protein